MDAAVVREAIALYQTGLSAAKVEAQLGIARGSLQYHLKKAGVSRPPKTIPWPVEAMREWYEKDGLSVTEIAAKLGESPKLVWKVCKRNKFQMRPVGCPGGEKHPCWEGGRLTDKDGYILVHQPDHPGANSNGYIREHRLVMSRQLGRPLRPEEVVHHKDGNKQNNDPSNLELFGSNADHLAATLAGQCPKWTEDGKRRIRAGVEKAKATNAERHRQRKSTGHQPQESCAPGSP